MSDCIFCRVIDGSMPSQKVYEDEDVIAFLDIQPINPGHTLVVPKRHADDFLKTDEGDLAKIMAVVKKITPGILKAIGADSFNLGVNTGRAAGQVVFHTHFHIMPRLSTDGYRLWHPRDDAPSDLKKIAERIREELKRSS